MVEEDLEITFDLRTASGEVDGMACSETSVPGTELDGKGV
jgi:hypothetical protein